MDGVGMFVFVAVMVGAVAQSTAGFGFALIGGSVLIVLLGPQEGLRLILLLSACINIALLLREGRHARVRDALLLLLPAIVATPLFLWILQRINVHLITIFAGCVTLLSAGMLAYGKRFTWIRGVRGAIGVGLVSAAMNAIGGLSGPAVALYAVNAEWPATTVRPTLQVYGLILNLVALASLGLPALPWLPFGGVLLGWAIGSLIAARLSQHTLRFFILLLAGFGGLLAIIRGFHP